MHGDWQARNEKKPTAVVEKLEFENEEQRAKRIQTSLERLNASSTSEIFQSPPFTSLDFLKRPNPSSDISSSTELLSRVHAFLPQLEASNKELLKRAQENPSSIDIEHVEAGTSQYIEMNLGLGVFVDRSRSKKNDSDVEMSSSSSEAEPAEEGSETETDSSSEIITSYNPPRPIRPLPKRRSVRPSIVVMDEESK